MKNILYIINKLDNNGQYKMADKIERNLSWNFQRGKSPKGLLISTYHLLKKLIEDSNSDDEIEELMNRKKEVEKELKERGIDPEDQNQFKLDLFQCPWENETIPFNVGKLISQYVKLVRKRISDMGDAIGGEEHSFIRNKINKMFDVNLSPHESCKMFYEIEEKFKEVLDRGQLFFDF